MAAPALKSSPTEILSLSGVSFRYDSVPVLAGVDLRFSLGQMVGVIGPNGAGKTTLLRLLMRLMAPSTGRIVLEGRALPEFTRRELARLIALVPQDTQIGYAFTVQEIVAMGRNPYLSRFQPPDKADVIAIQSAMHQTGLEGLADRPINTLSGGERQRVLIARTIAQQTPVVLLDEATANLDLCHQLEVMEFAQALAVQGRLVIATIHDLAMASRYCDRLILLNKGGVQADGTAEDVLTARNLEEHFALRARIDRSAHLQRGLSITPIAPITH